MFLAALKMVKSAPIPPHLFGELVRTPSGTKLLFKLAGKTILDHVDQLICLSPEKRCLPYVKAAIWTIAHIASTVHGFNLLPKGVVALLGMKLFISIYINQNFIEFKRRITKSQEAEH